MRRRRDRSAVATEVAGTQVIGEDENDVRPLLIRRVR
jgi:hypothetical protein